MFPVCKPVTNCDQFVFLGLFKLEHKIFGKSFVVSFNCLGGHAVQCGKVRGRSLPFSLVSKKFCSQLFPVAKCWAWIILSKEEYRIFGFDFQIEGPAAELRGILLSLRKGILDCRSLTREQAPKNALAKGFNQSRVEKSGNRRAVYRKHH
jgi:hypothetical protein